MIFLLELLDNLLRQVKEQQHEIQQLRAQLEPRPAKDESPEGGHEG